jgi:hypothetical protein
MKTTTSWIPIALVLLVCACSTDPSMTSHSAWYEEIPGTQVQMDFTRGEGFYTAPFPSDDLRREDGSVEMNGFPNPDRIGYMDNILDILERGEGGFGLASAVFFSLTEPVSLDALPDLSESLQPGSPVFLLDVDRASPETLRRIPVDIRFMEDGGPFGAPNLLSLLPLQGIPLRPRTTYAAVVLRSLRDHAGDPLGISLPLARILSGQRPDGLSQEVFDSYLAALGRLKESGTALNQIAGMTVFTTGDPVTELDRFREAVLALPLPEPTGPFVRNEIFDDFCVYQTEIPMPVYQAGDPPYLLSGGAWALDEDGNPELQAYEQARMVLTLPRAAMPDEGFPVVIFSRTGAGGDRPLVDRGRRTEPGGPAVAPGTGPALEFARAGFAAVSVDGPHGGLRNVTGADEQFLVFNFLNPLALRDNVRQSTLELVLQAHVLEYLEVAVGDCPGLSTGEGGPAILDVSRMALMGHSMGATILQPALLVEPRFRAAILSGGGGSYLENLIHKKSPIDVKPLAELILGYPFRGQELTEHDPAVSLVQWASEPADPPVYNLFLAERIEGGPHILMLQGIMDTYIPPPVANASSLSLGLDLAGEALDADHPELRHLRPLKDLLRFSERGQVHLPVSGNRTTAGGEPRTAVVVQHPEDGVEDGHEVVFQTEPPKCQYRSFLESFAAGLPRVPALEECL